MRNFLYFINIIFHNLNLFKKKKYKKNRIVLIEFNRLASSVISYSYLSNVLCEKFKANIYAYRLTAKKNSIKDFLWKILSKIYFTNTFNVYRSFGTNSFINPSNFQISKEDYKKINNIEKKIKNKSDLLKLRIGSIYIGDLIYDSYLMNFREATINLRDKKFVEYLRHSLKNFFAWKKFFSTNDVKAVIVSHSVYTLAIPLRIAISKNINSYQCSSLNIYRLSKKNIYAYKDFLYFKKTFKKLNDYTKRRSIISAKNKIKKKFSGINLSLGATKSAYRKKFYKKIIKKNDNTKILIATHCFFDNPHPYGQNLFVDFYEWLNFLGKLSLKTKYDWYIKLHPDYLDGTKKIILDFLNKYPNIKYIPSKYSHHQLIAEGIDIALTCWGSIAHEYPLFKKTVINCSRNNPHINYDFSLHPKSIKEYEHMILKLKKFKKKINLDSIYEFYAMNFILKKSWMIESFYDLIDEQVYDYYYQFKPAFYNYWLTKEFNNNKHFKMIKKIKQFINANDYLMEWNKKDIDNLYAK